MNNYYGLTLLLGSFLSSVTLKWIKNMLCYLSNDLYHFRSRTENHKSSWCFQFLTIRPIFQPNVWNNMEKVQILAFETLNKSFKFMNIDYSTEQMIQIIYKNYPLFELSNMNHKSRMSRIYLKLTLIHNVELFHQMDNLSRVQSRTNHHSQRKRL